MFSKKVYCLYHHDSFITNFCNNKQCLMPLCPVCIREHSQYHQQVQTKPNYYSIAETAKQVQQTMLQSINQLEKHQDNLSNVMRQNLQFQKSIKERISTAKSLAIGWVQQKFKVFQVEIIKKLNSFAYDKGLRGIQETNNHFKQVQSKLKNIYKMVESLQTQRFLATIITFLKQESSQLTKQNRVFSSYIESQSKVFPKISINLDIKSHFLNTLEKIIKIEVQQVFKQKSPRTSPLHTNRALNSSRFGKMQKKQDMYTPQNSAQFIKDRQSKQTKRSLNKFKPSNSPYYLMHRKSLQINQHELQTQNPSHRFSQQFQTYI